MQLCNHQKDLFIYKLEMCANAQHDGRPAKYRWRRLLLYKRKI